MHKQTTAVNPTGVNKIPHNFHTPCAAIYVAVQLLKGLSARTHLNGRSASKGYMNLQTAFCGKYKLCSVSYKMWYIFSLLKQMKLC